MILFNPYNTRDTVKIERAGKDAPIINTQRAKWKATRYFGPWPQFTNHFSTEQAAINYTKKHGYKEHIS